MKRLTQTTVVIVFASVFAGCAKPVDHPEIRSVLDSQVSAWNSGNLEGFMAGYWKSDEMVFSTPKDTTKGWQATLDRYRKRYADPKAMGRLKFEELHIAPMKPDFAEASGRYVQHTPDGLKTGRFYLKFRKIDGAWVITHDHTTPDE